MTSMKDMAADIILFNGKIISGDLQDRIYQAAAVKKDIIMELGTDEEVLALKGEGTRLVNLRGRTVIPGLVETHAHVSWAALSEVRGELFIPNSVKELLEYIRKRVKAIGPGEWLYFKNTYPTRLDEYRFPTMEELDDAAPENPVYVDGAYAGQANTCALKIAGIDENTVPLNGRLCRDQRTGKLNGTLFLCGDLIKKHIEFPKYSDNEMVEGIMMLQEQYNRLGITSVIDGMTNPQSVYAYNHMYKKGSLNMRMVYTCMADRVEDVDIQVKDFLGRIDTPSNWGKLAFFKVSLDGGILTGTSYMRRPYTKEGAEVFGIDNPEFRGIIKLTEDQLMEYIRKVQEHGLQMTAHCIGDAATDRLVAAYSKINSLSPINGKRYTIIHADFTDEKILKKIKDLGLVLITQPAWHYKDGSVLRRVLDEQTMKTFLPYRDMEELDIRVCAGSDHMVKHDSFLSQNPYNPFLGIYNLVTRKTCKGDVINPDQRVSRQRALRMYTLEGAHATFDEGMKGSLEKGKYADLAVLNKDLMSCPEDEIPTIESELTMVGGRIVYDKYISKPD